MTDKARRKIKKEFEHKKRRCGRLLACIEDDIGEPPVELLDSPVVREIDPCADEYTAMLQSKTAARAALEAAALLVDKSMDDEMAYMICVEENGPGTGMPD